MLRQCVLFKQTIIEHTSQQNTPIHMKLKSILHYFFKSKPESPVNTLPQQDVRLDKYLGRWYEQARYENWFESGLDEVFTDYSTGPGGSINVLNCGKNHRGLQSTSKGRGYPAGRGRLNVSFVPPYGWFRAPYHILYVDPDYQSALVSGENASYLWLLTREKTPQESLLSTLIGEAEKRGFNTSELRFTRQ